MTPFGDECDRETQAMLLLKSAGYEEVGGVYYHPDNAEIFQRAEEPAEAAALDYLCGEWDYASTNTPEDIQKLMQKKLDKEVKGWYNTSIGWRETF